MRPEPIHILILVIVIVVIFGAAKLPSIAKNIGKSMKVFKSEIKDLREDSDSENTSTKAAPTEITDAKATGPQPSTGTAGTSDAERADGTTTEHK